MSLQGVATAVLTGGAVMLDLSIGSQGAESSATGTLTISRSTGVGPPAIIYTGAPQIFWLDINEGQPGSLDPGISYVYVLTDSLTTVTLPAVLCPSGIVVVPNGHAAVMLRLVEGFARTITLPPDVVTRPTVMSAMPLQGFPSMPFLIVYQELLQQAEVPIGQQVPQQTLPLGQWTAAGQVTLVWRITIVTKQAAERDFWRDAMYAFFQGALTSVFAPVGLNTTHSFQANSYQTTEEKEKKQPGFYAADIMLTAGGTFNVIMQSLFNRNLNIDFTASVLGDTTSVQVELPLRPTPYPP